MKKLAILSLTCLVLAGPAAAEPPSCKVDRTVKRTIVLGPVGGPTVAQPPSSEVDRKANTERELELKEMTQARAILAWLDKARSVGPLAELAAGEALEAQYAGNESALSTLRSMISQLLLPRIGDYAGAHRYADLSLSQTRAPEPPAALEGYAPVNALQAIAEAAGTRQIVMINEAHHVPQHRAFTLELLGELKKQGFTYFAAETLSQDPDLARRGYPTGRTGGYIPEPLYGDLVRTALRLGYKIVPYESEDANSGPGGRERDQARHLQERIFARDPKAKVLVHAGYAHIFEIPGPRAMMAAVFKEMTGIDPLTINQDWMTEHSAPEFESPVYRWATERGLVNEPVIFRNAAGEPWSRPKAVDMVVFHPRSRYENGRPHWLRMGGLRSPYPLLAAARLPAVSSRRGRRKKGRTPSRSIRFSWRRASRSRR
jgi:hypothetical protein